MKIRLGVVGLAATLAAGAGCVPAPPVTTATPGATAEASVIMHNRTGDRLGTLRLEQTENGLRIRGQLSGLPAGSLGFHVHEVGRCDRPSFDSAGEHFAPGDNEHGFLNPRGPHAGDMRNLRVGANGHVNLDALAERVSLTPGTRNSIVGGEGKSLIIHQSPDDYVTDPSGNSGDRIACGIIR